MVNFQRLEWVECDKNIANVGLWIFKKIKELNIDEQGKSRQHKVKCINTQNNSAVSRLNTSIREEKYARR